MLALHQHSSNVILYFTYNDKVDPFVRFLNANNIQVHKVTENLVRINFEAFMISFKILKMIILDYFIDLKGLTMLFGLKE